jgi:hypothetical protein
MKAPLVALSLVLATAAFGAASALSFAREDWIASPSQ